MMQNDKKVKGDFKNYSCPVPLIETKKLIDNNLPGTSFIIEVKSLNAKDNISAMLDDLKYEHESINKGDYYEISFTI